MVSFGYSCIISFSYTFFVHNVAPNLLNVVETAVESAAQLEISFLMVL